jgi:hypothetical protein
MVTALPLRLSGWAAAPLRDMLAGTRAADPPVLNCFTHCCRAKGFAEAGNTKTSPRKSVAKKMKASLDTKWPIIFSSSLSCCLLSWFLLQFVLQAQSLLPRRTGATVMQSLGTLSPQCV